MTEDQPRYAGCRTYVDTSGRIALTDRKPFRFRPYPDNRTHAVRLHDTLPHLAAWYFAPLPRACGYWWVLADFQPQPAVDPLVPLHQRYQHIVVPSLRVLTDVILTQARGDR